MQVYLFIQHASAASGGAHSPLMPIESPGADGKTAAEYNAVMAPISDFGFPDGPNVIIRA